MKNYLSNKVRKDRWACNFAILKQRPITLRHILKNVYRLKFYFQI